MPDPGGDVRAHVGVELVLLDGVGEVVLVPRTVGPLHPDEPCVRRFGLGHPPAERECHRRFDVVPRVSVPTGEPRDHPRRQLPLGDALDGARQLGGRDDIGHIAQVHQVAAPCGLRA